MSYFTHSTVSTKVASRESRWEVARWGPWKHSIIILKLTLKARQIEDMSVWRTKNIFLPNPSAHKISHWKINFHHVYDSRTKVTGSLFDFLLSLAYKVFPHRPYWKQYQTPIEWSDQESRQSPPVIISWMLTSKEMWFWFLTAQMGSKIKVINRAVGWW